jgi:type II secretory pathway pseudopilin PulG
MNINNKQKNSGFTLVEAMFAIMILTFSIVAMMTVVSSSLFNSRYARDEITAGYLAQEVIDSIRNDRDTSVFLQDTQSVGDAWTDFVAKYSNCSNPTRGCYFDVLNFDIFNPIITQCPFGQSNCIDLYYDGTADSTAFYTSDDGLGNSSKSKSGFQRKIVVVQNVSNPDEIDVTVTIYWKNGSIDKSRSLSTTLMKWQS